jgi:hypothetical protein
MFDKIECLERAAYCTRLAEAEADPQLRHLFKTLAFQWIQVAREKEERAADTLASAES